MLCCDKVILGNLKSVIYYVLMKSFPRFLFNQPAEIIGMMIEAFCNAFVCKGRVGVIFVDVGEYVFAKL